MPAGGLAFTLAQVPVVVTTAAAPSLTVHLADGSTVACEGLTLDAELTRRWFARQGEVRQVEVRVTEAAFR